MRVLSGPLGKISEKENDMWVNWYENGKPERLSCINIREAAMLVLELAVHPEILYTSIEVDGTLITEMPIGWIKNALTTTYVVHLQDTAGAWYAADKLAYYKTIGISGVFSSPEQAWKQISACRDQIKVPMSRVRVREQ